MRLSVCFVVFVFVVLAAGSLGYAHQTNAIQVNIQGDRVEIEVEHPVQNEAQHYIEEIDIKLNGKGIIEQEFMAQTSKDSQKVVYIIPGLKKGDALDISAECSVTGEKKRKVIVE